MTEEQRQEIDKLIANAERRLNEAMQPLRVRDKRKAANDGYDNSLTEVEAMVRAPYVSLYRWELDHLRELKAHLEEQNDS